MYFFDIWSRLSEAHGVFHQGFPCTGNDCRHWNHVYAFTVAHILMTLTRAAEFQVSNGFLIKTYADTPHPNTSAGEDHMEHTPVPTSVYVVEPRRASSAVLKFSGTLGMHNCSDKWSVTIMAFSHFVIEDTACLHMFADIQGIVFWHFTVPFTVCWPPAGLMDRSAVAQNESILTLFNPMTHTSCGYIILSFVLLLHITYHHSHYSQSSLGDHGFKGFEEFVKCHKCTHICSSMNLCTISVLSKTLEEGMDEE